MMIKGDCHRGRRGPDAGVGSRLRCLAPELDPRLRADLPVAIGDVARTPADLEYTVEMDPDFDQARLALASLLPAREALKVLRRAPMMTAPLHCAVGMALLDLDDPGAAKEAFDLALAQDGLMVEALLLRGFVHQKAGRFEAAAADYRLALTREHADVQAALDGLARCESALGVGEDMYK